MPAEAQAALSRQEQLALSGASGCKAWRGENFERATYGAG